MSLALYNIVPEIGHKIPSKGKLQAWMLTCKEVLYAFEKFMQYLL